MEKYEQESNPHKQVAEQMDRDSWIGRDTVGARTGMPGEHPLPGPVAPESSAYKEK